MGTEAAIAIGLVLYAVVMLTFFSDCDQEDRKGHRLSDGWSLDSNQRGRGYLPVACGSCTMKFVLA